MRILALAALAAIALPIAATPASAQYRGGYAYNGGYAYGHRNREVRDERRECRRELRHARNRWQYERELRECRRELAEARRHHRRYRHRGW